MTDTELPIEYQIMLDAFATPELQAARQSFRTAITKDTANWNLWLELAQASKGYARRQALARAAELAPRSTEVAQLRHASR